MKRNLLLSFLVSAISVTALALGGCVQGKNYAAPNTELAPAFSEANGTSDLKSRPEAGVDGPARWWQTFHDPELDSLVKRAIAGNRDLKVAASRVRQARIQRAIALGGNFPSIDATGGYNRGHGSNNVNLPFGGSSSGSSASSSSSSAGTATTRSIQADTVATDSATVPTIPSASGSGGSTRPAGPTNPLGEGGLPGLTTNLYQIGFDASWEIDLFGGQRRAVEAAGAEVQAIEEAQRGALISLLGEVAETYLQLRADQQRLALAKRNVSVAEETLSIVRAKFKNGFGTDLEVARQRAEVATLSAAIPALETSERLYIHALSVMLGEKPNMLSDELSAAHPLPSLPAEIPIGLPSDLLRRRPDIRRAERKIAVATARTGIATSDLFPKFNLAAAVGLDSSKPGDLFERSSHYYSVTPGIRWPILDWGRARNNVTLSNEAEKESMIRYESVVAQAVLEVENALVRFRGEQIARTSRAEALAASQTAFTIALQRYEHGLVDSLVVLDAQRSLLLSEDALEQSDAAIRLDLVSLYKALGGGWES